MSTSNYPADGGSFIVGRDDPLPSFVIEVTSPHFLDNDIVRKPLDYAALGIAEFLRIDPWSNRDAPWQLTGYRLGSGPFYNEITPDAEGGLTFQTIGLRFVGIGRETVQVFEAVIGEQLTPPEDWLQQAQAAAEARVQAEERAVEAEARAAVEAQARAEAEARLAEYAELLKKAGLL